MERAFGRDWARRGPPAPSNSEALFYGPDQLRCRAFTYGASVRGSERKRATVRVGKVGNFYNNIVALHSGAGDVTVDTQAIAAALLRPLSGDAKDV